MSGRLVKIIPGSVTTSKLRCTSHLIPDPSYCLPLPDSSGSCYGYHVHHFAKWPRSSSLLRASFHLIFCLNISIPVSLYVLNTITFNSFSPPGVCKPKLFFPSAPLGVWCLRTAQGRKCLDPQLRYLVSWSQGTQAAENALLLDGPPCSNQASGSQTTCLWTHPCLLATIHAWIQLLLSGRNVMGAAFILQAPKPFLCAIKCNK